VRQGKAGRGKRTDTDHSDEYLDLEAEDELRMRQKTENTLAENGDEDEDEVQGTRGRSPRQQGQRGGRGRGGRGQAGHRGSRTPTKRGNSVDKSAARAGQKKRNRQLAVQESGDEDYRTPSGNSDQDTFHTPRGMPEETGSSDGVQRELTELRAFRKWAEQQEPGISRRFAEGTRKRKR